MIPESIVLTTHSPCSRGVQKAHILHWWWVVFFFKAHFLWKYTLACGMCFLKNPCITKDWQIFLNTLTGSEASSNCYLINIRLLSSQSHASSFQPLPVCPRRPAASGLRKRLTTTDCAAGWAFRLFWNGRPKQGGLSREDQVDSERNKLKPKPITFADRFMLWSKGQNRNIVRDSFSPKPRNFYVDKNYV